MARRTLTAGLPSLPVGGFQTFSTTDWPGQLSATVFTQGCPLRCSYCHNPHLIPLQPATGTAGYDMNMDAVLDWLRPRQGLLDAVVFSGGEPCIHAGLSDAVQSVRRLGFKVGLHTAGTHPARLAEVLPLVDWIGLDVKAANVDYARVAGAACGQRVLRSLDILVDSSMAFETRTTWHAGLFPEASLIDLAQTLARAGVAHFVLQRARQPIAQAAVPVEWVRSAGPTQDTLQKLNQLFVTFESRG